MDIDLESTSILRFDSDEIEHFEYDVEELLGSLHSAALVAEEDWKEAQFAIADLKGARAQLKNERGVSDLRKQTRAKKEAIYLQLEYLEHTLLAYEEFNLHIDSCTPSSRHEVNKVAAALTHVFNTSHERIHSVLSLPLSSAKAYTKSINLRTGDTKRFLQHHPAVAASLPITAGILSIAGLSFIFGPFSLAALAFFIPATDSVLKGQMHKDTKVLRELKRASHQMKRMSRRVDAEGLRKTLEYAASADDARTIAKIGLERNELGIDVE